MSKRKIANGIMLLVFLSLISGVMGYFIISYEPDGEDAIQTVQAQIRNDADEREKRLNRANFDEDVDFARGSDIAKARQEYQSTIENYGIGSVYMPTAKISVPLLAGTSEYNLFNGVATGRANQTLGEGLFIGLSHNLINQTLLQNIDQLSVGDPIYVTDFEHVYKYVVRKQDVVHETEEKYFREPDADEPAKILLYRCEGETGTEWRQIAYGDYEAKVGLGQASHLVREGLGIETLTTTVDEKSESIKQESVDEPTIENEMNTPNNQNKKQSKGLLARVANWLADQEIIATIFLTSYQWIDEHMFLYGGLVTFLFVLFMML